MTKDKPNVAVNGHEISGDDKARNTSSAPRVETPSKTIPPENDAYLAYEARHGCSAVVDTSNRVNNKNGPGSAWSHVASRAAKLPFKDLARDVSNVRARSKVLLLNADGHRLDHPMTYDAQKVAEMKKHKYCNQHYIGKGCCHYICGNDNCPHRHDVDLSKEDKQWLRLVARETVCKKGTSCRDPDCIYGHHCPYPKHGSVCVNGDGCRFRAMHGMDLTVASRTSTATTPLKERVG
jgi:hypothetical protein